MKYFLCGICMLICAAADCWADTIVLKNKESIHGIIIDEGENSIVLDVGFGTVTFQRAEIESVGKSDEVSNARIRKDWRRDYFESLPAPTAEDQKILDEFKDLIDRKRTIERNILKKENIAWEISVLQQDIPRLQEKLQNIGGRLKAEEDKKDVKAYNALVVEFNEVSAELNNAVDELNELQTEQENINEEVVRCVKQFRHFDEIFTEKYKNINTNETLTAQQIDFYHNLGERLDRLKEDIKQEEVKFSTRKGHVVVEAVLNNKIEVSLLVDTGATLTVICEEVAVSLGIDVDELKQDVELVMADARHVKAKFILLSSVKVGDVEAKNVAAAIVEDRPSAEIDGFLGMSFLRNFSFSIDTAEQKLLFDFFE